MKKLLVILMVVAMASFLFVGCLGVPETYTLTMAVNPTGGGTTNPAVGAHPNYTAGTLVSISATPATGYKFVNWTGDVAGPNLASTTVTMDADKTVTAKFELITVVTTTVAPIITAVSDIDITSTATQYVSKAEAVDGITVTGTAPTYSEVKIYIDGICAGTGDAGANGQFTVVVAKADLGTDGEKTLYATATDIGLAESAHSDEKKFTLDTVAPKIKAVKARGGTAAVGIVPQPTYQTFPATVGPPVTPPMFTSALFQAAQLLPGVVNWKIEVLSIIGTPDIVTVRVSNLTAGTTTDYSFNNIAGPPTASSTSWIPGAIVTIAEPVAAGTEVGLNSALHVGAYCLITTTRTGAIRGRVSLTYNEDVTWTQATTGNYTIFNNSLGWDILGIFGRTAFMAYNETTDTMFWQETIPTWDLIQGDWLTFQVDTVADIAGNTITVGSPETANCTVLAPTVAIGP